MFFWMQIAFWTSIFGVVYTYFIYPLLMFGLSKIKKLKWQEYAKNDLPNVAIILAVYNEDKVIQKKIETTLETNYPKDKITFYIGSDNSDDETNSIILENSKKYNIQFKEFKNRIGKAGIINQIAEKVNDEVLIFTDANVFFEPKTIFELVKNFKDYRIGVVSANIINEEVKKEGISFQEKTYLQYEKGVKTNEGDVFGSMVGAFGGCYAIRKSCFKSVPKNYLMDDFFISMNVFNLRKKAILNKLAICYEDVSDKLSEEFRRKVRISAGNFQNLYSYKHLLFKLLNPISFTFFSHKILRWVTPFFLLIALISSVFLFKQITFFYYVLIVEICLILLTFVEILLNRLNINIRFLRFLTHFFGMNLALFLGFFKFLFGVKTSVWKPTERFQ